jgi:DNA-binding beta-propeller fold protein YncE
MPTEVPRARRKVTIPGLTEQSGAPADWRGRPPGAPPDLAGQPQELEYVAERGHRSRWLAVIVASVLVLAAVGGGLYLARHKTPHPRAAQRTRQAAGLAPAATAALKPPSCGAAIGTGRSSVIRPAGLLTVPAPPYGAITTADLGFTFIALPTAIEVLHNRAGIPVNPPVRTIPIPDHPHAQTLTSDGRYLLTATDHGVTVIKVSAAERPGPGDPVVGLLPSGLPGNPGGDDLTLSTNDRYVFVALRYANKIAVFNLAKALHTRFGAADLVGYAPAGIKPHGMAVSADGRWLYVTSRFARPGTLEGTLSVLSVRAAETHPARSVVSSAAAGCGAFRVIASPDGSVLWVIAQSSNYLVGFSAAKLRTDPRHALIAKVAIGAIPLDEVLVNGGTRLLVTDNAGADLAVVDPAAALAGSKRALVGYVKTAALPRFFAFEPDGPVVLLVTGDRTDQIQSIRTGDLP